MWTLFLILPGLLAAYFIFLRPVLRAIPALKQFYDNADGFWAKVSAIGGHSASVAWGLFLSLVGTVFQWLDPIASALGEPDLKQQIIDALKDNPSYLADALMVISAVTIAARLRSIAKA